MKEIAYEEWYEKNEEELYIKFAETGMDRELDFNVENEIEKEYEKWKTLERSITVSAPHCVAPRIFSTSSSLPALASSGSSTG